MKHFYSTLLLAFNVLFLSLQSVGQTTEMNDMVYHSRHIYLKSVLNGKPANFVFDTGADMVYVDSTFLAGSGLKFSKVGYAMLGGVGGKQQKVKMIFDDAILNLYGKEYKPKMAPVIQLKPILGDKADGLFGIQGLSGKSDHIGLIGNKVWERFYVIIDLKNKRLYLKPNSLFNKMSVFNTLGFTFTDRSKTLGCWVVNGLYHGSEAGSAGLKGGDRILEVNGKDVKSISEVEQEAIYKTKGEVTLSVKPPQGEMVKRMIFSVL